MVIFSYLVYYTLNCASRLSCMLRRTCWNIFSKEAPNVSTIKQSFYCVISQRIKGEKVSLKREHGKHKNCSNFIIKRDYTDYSLTFSVTDGNEHPRLRRSLLQFYQMISCATNNNPLKYNFYGFYCGLGGTGTPVDGLDRQVTKQRCLLR